MYFFQRTAVVEAEGQLFDNEHNGIKCHCNSADGMRE